MMTLSLKKITLTFIVLSFVLIPVFSDAAPLVPCGRTGQEPCDYAGFETLIQNFINWAVVISSSLAALAFAYAGFLYLTGGSNPSTRQKAKDVFTKVLIGLIIVLSAWLIVQAVLTGLDFDQSISPLS